MYTFKYALKFCSPFLISLGFWIEKLDLGSSETLEPMLIGDLSWKKIAQEATALLNPPTNSLLLILQGLMCTYCISTWKQNLNSFGLYISLIDLLGQWFNSLILWWSY